MFLTLKLDLKLLGRIILVVIIFFSLTYCFQPGSIPATGNDMEFKVVIDPGHGSIDTGASYHDLYEKDINLAIGKLLRQELKSVNIIPIMTREEDKLYMDSRNKDIAYRPRLARQHQADLFISIHTNKFPSSQPAGSQIFYKSSSTQSKELAQSIQQELAKLRPENNRALKRGDYYVLNQCPCPAVLIEVGFLSNQDDRKKLTDQSYQQALASSIKSGIINYFQTRFSPDSSKDESKEKPVLVTVKDSSVYYLTTAKNRIHFIKTKLSYPAAGQANREASAGFQASIASKALERLATPPAGLLSPLPPGTKVNSLRVENNIAIIDFSKEIRENFQGGAGLELNLLESMKKTLLSIPGIEGIEIQIDGEKGQSIGGHIVLDRVFK
ncbi:MAG: N-acetylmuramoyl-L-alanine amidase [Halanaerobiales bacterium]|nr:N-acetylmuramoyl-L-alanine amidase [Halanaerobiales bacterium]